MTRFSGLLFSGKICFIKYEKNCFIKGLACGGDLAISGCRDVGGYVALRPGVLEVTLLWWAALKGVCWLLHQGFKVWGA